MPGTAKPLTIKEEQECRYYNVLHNIAFLTDPIGMVCCVIVISHGEVSFGRACSKKAGVSQRHLPCLALAWNAYWNSKPETL